MQTLLLIAAVAGTSLLWRTYRYDEENAFNVKLDALPYAIRKPITCGLCFTFWVSLLAVIIFSPFGAWLFALPYRFAVPLALKEIVGIFVSWMTLGSVSTLAVYVIDTFYQLSHYYKHAAHSH